MDGKLNQSTGKLSVHIYLKFNASFVLAIPPNLNLSVLLKNEINWYNIIFDTATVLQQCLPEPNSLNRRIWWIPSLKRMNQMLE